MSDLIEVLFKVEPMSLFNARIEFALSTPMLILACAFAVFVALALGGYLPPKRHFVSLMLLRAALAIAIVVLLARPEVLVPVPDKDRAPVMVLVDHSLSMSIADSNDAVTRGQRAEEMFGRGEISGRLLRELESRFPVRVKRFASRRLESGEGEVMFAGAVSDPLGALLQAASTGRSSGLVLASDGGRLSGRSDNDLLLRLRAVGVPVHVVGFGGKATSPDARVRAVSVPTVVFPGDRVDLTAWIDANGFDGDSLRVTVRDDGVLLGQAEALVSQGRAVARLSVTLEEPGFRGLAVGVHAGDADRVPQNDVLWQPVRVRREPARVLHFEGEPRFEVKFLRRAVYADEAIALSSLVRTGDNRFLRLGIEDPEELSGGFPTTAKELFAYDLIIVGSVEAAALGEQGASLLKEFVERRGASVLFLGGRNALAEGGYSGTPVAELLPVRLATPDPDYNRAAAVVLTPEGRRHPVTRDLMTLDGAERSTPLPALAVVNPVRQARPGASVLLRGEDGDASPVAMLAWHRFAAGRVAVLPARDTWRWRMHADVAPDDQTHRVFWRRLVRWLAREVPRPIRVEVTPPVAAPGQTVEIRTWSRASDWTLRRDVKPEVEVTTPLGDIHARPMVWTAHSDDGFSTQFVARDAGVHEIRVVVPEEGEATASTAEAGLLVNDVGDEFRSTGLDDTLLRRIAAETGGSYRHVDDVAGLADRVEATAPARVDLRRVTLWDAPVVLLILLALAILEWWLRRRHRELP